MKRSIAVLSFLSSLCISISALAQWTPDGVPVCTLPETQVHAAIAPDGAGGIIMAWEDSRALAGTGIDIYMQRLNGSGIPQWTAGGAPLCSHTADQMFLTAVSDGAGGAIFVWVDRRDDPATLYAQRVDANGALLWAADGVMVCNGEPDPIFCVVTTDANGGAIVSWLDMRSADPDIYAQRMSAAGTRLWGDGGAPVCTAAGLQHGAYLIADSAGGAIMAWGDERSDLGDVYAQRVSALGSPMWTLNGVPVFAAILRQSGGALVSDGLGGAIITCVDGRTNNNPNQRNIYAQRVNAAGTSQWTANGVPVCAAFGEQFFPVPVTDGAGGAVIAWSDYRAVNWDIYAQRVNGAGAAQWTANGVALCTAPNTQWFPGVVPDGAGGAIVMWADFRSSTENDDIYAQRVSAAGSTMWMADGVPVCTAPYIQHAPTITSDGLGGAIIAWDDTRSWDGVQPLDSFFDIYTARVAASGWVISGAGDSPPLRGLVLMPAFPNPFSGTTRLELVTSGTSAVALDVFDVSGKRVRHQNIGNVEAGRMMVELDGRDQAGQLLPSGVYFCRVSAGADRATQKILLMR